MHFGRLANPRRIRHTDTFGIVEKYSLKNITGYHHNYSF